MSGSSQPSGAYRVLRTTAPGAKRTVVADDGRAIRLTLYRGAEALGTAMPDPVRTVGLASELIAAAYRRFAG